MRRIDEHVCQTGRRIAIARWQVMRSVERRTAAIPDSVREVPGFQFRVIAVQDGSTGLNPGDFIIAVPWQYDAACDLDVWGRHEWVPEDADVRRYNEAAGAYATCRFVRSVGSSSVDSSVEPFIELHDQITRAQSNLPLA